MRSSGFPDGLIRVTSVLVPEFLMTRWQLFNSDCNDLPFTEPGLPHVRLFGDGLSDRTRGLDLGGRCASRRNSQDVRATVSRNFASPTVSSEALFVVQDWLLGTR